MKLEIIIADGSGPSEKGDKEAFLNGKFLASWGPKVDNMEIIIPYALDEAVKIGMKIKQDQIKKVLGV